jgi:hypothetical protein
MNEPGIGHNRPPLTVRVAELVATCNKWTAERPVIETAELAAICEDFHRQLRQCRDELEDAQKAELQPHNEAIGRIRAAYRDPLMLIGIAYTKTGQLKTAWLEREQQRLDAEAIARKRQAEEAQARAERAMDKAAAAGTVEAEADLERAVAEAAEAEAEAASLPKRAQVRGDLSSKAASLRTYWHAMVLDPAKAVQSYIRDDKVVEALLAAANRHARIARNEAAAPPGVRFYSTRKA